MLNALQKFLLACVIGTLTRTDLVGYANPDFMGIPWWAVAAYGIGSAVAVFLWVGWDRMMRTRVDYPGGGLALEYLLLAAIYSLILFFRTSPYLLVLGLSLIILLRLIFFHQPWDLSSFLIGACVGPTLELILAAFHLYFFTEPDFLGMPYWLPLLMGNIAIALRRLSWVLVPPPPVTTPQPSVLR